MNTGKNKIKKILAAALADRHFSCAHFEIGSSKGSHFSYYTGYRQLLPEPVLADENTLYDLASVTKIMVTTILCLKFIENGDLCLGDKLARFYPDLGQTTAAITIKELLTHTSGIGSASLTRLDKEKVDREILARPLKHAPGSQVEYSCPGFIVLGKLLEKISGAKLAALAYEMVFYPLSMQNTSFRPGSNNVAASSKDSKLLGVVNDFNARYLADPVGNAGLFATLADCVKFARMLLRGGAADKVRVISNRMLELATREHTPGLNESRGLGFFNPRVGSWIMGELFSERAFGHGGWTGTSLIVDPGLDLYAVFLTNRTHLRTDNYEEMMRIRKTVHNVAVAHLQGAWPGQEK